MTRTMGVSFQSPRVTTHRLDLRESVRDSNSRDLINLAKYTTTCIDLVNFLVGRRLGLPVLLAY